VALTQRLTEALPTPVLVMAEPGEGLRLHEARAAGAVGCLVKPFTDECLRPAIEGALRLFAERAAFYAARGPLCLLGPGGPAPGGAGGHLIAVAQQLLMRAERMTQEEALHRLFSLSRAHMETLEEAAQEVVRASWER
jgi:AmiR/NasT family two-component response regulator